MNKKSIFLLLLASSCFSCTSKGEKVKAFVEKEVVSQVEDYYIQQAIIKFVREDLYNAFEKTINYYASNPYYDYSYMERDLGSPFMSLASISGATKASFDKRWNMAQMLLEQLWYAGNLDMRMRIVDSTLTYKDMLKEPGVLSLEEIANIFFKPDHMKFTEITPRLAKEIFLSILTLGAANYKYDVVDEIRVREKEKSLWSVDMVYHSGNCMAIEVSRNDNDFYVSKAPWLSDTWCYEEE